MLGLGIIKGTIIGVGISVIAGLTLKKLCKKKKIISSDNVETNNGKNNT